MISGIEPSACSCAASRPRIPGALARPTHPRVCSAGELATTRSASTSTRSRALPSSSSRSRILPRPCTSSCRTSATARSAARSPVRRAPGSCPAARSTRACSRRSTPRAAAGTSLDTGVADKLSPSLGDLSDVRVHTDSTAHDLNHAVSARAFATGTDVYFAQDQYKPNTLGRRQADRARARARRPAARRAHERAADRLESWRRHGARGGRRGRQDRAVVAEPQQAAISFGFIDRRVMAAVERVAGLGSGSGRSVPRPLHLRRGRAAAHAGRVAVGRRRAPAGRRRRARAGPAGGRGARGLRRDRAQPPLRPPVRVPAGRRHAQAAEPAARRPAARGRRADARPT